MKTLRVVDTNEPRRPLSEARQQLAKLIDERLAIEDRIKALVEAAERLQGVEQAEQEAIAALNALSAAETASMAAWARDPAGPSPAQDVAKREELQGQHRAAAAKAAAARAAHGSIVTERQREHAVLKQIEPQITLAIAEIIAEAATGSMVEDLRAAVAAAVEKQVRVQQALASVFALADAIGNDEAARPIRLRAEQLSAELRAAAAPPAPDGQSSHIAWLRFAAALRADASAEFGEG